MIDVKCQFCKELKQYPGEITQESAKQVLGDPRWVWKKKYTGEWTSLWRCKRCAGEGQNFYIDANGDQWEILAPKNLSRQAVLAQSMDTIFDEHGLWSAVEEEEQRLADQKENISA